MIKNRYFSIVLFNLIPFFGIFYFRWDLYAFLSLYWLETAILGLFNVFKLFFIPYEDRKESYRNIFWWSLIFLFLIYVTSLFFFADKEVGTISLNKLAMIFDEKNRGISYSMGIIFLIEFLIFIKFIFMKEYKKTPFRKLYITPLLRVLFIFVGPALMLLFAVYFMPFFSEAIAFQFAAIIISIIKILIELFFASRGYF